MSRSSPGVRRVAAILNFIADHPGQAFALTDLVRALKLSRATCHALLTGLVDVGYLYRTSDKTYVLGPALAAIGQTAAQHFSPLQIAQPEMRALADEFDVVCGAYFQEGDILHLRERAASASHVGYPVPMGLRMNMHWTQALVYFSRSERDAQAWLDRTDPKPTEENIATMRQGMEFVSENGFVVHVRRAGFSWEDGKEEAFVPPEGNDVPIRPELDLEAGKIHPVAAIMAPVYDAKGKVPLSLVVAGFRNGLSGEEAMAVGARVRETCERISRFVAGKQADLI